MKRDMVNLIEADEVHERVGVFLVDKPGKDTQRLIIDARISNLHFLHPPGVSLVTSEGLSRVEVALENDDVDAGELSRLASLHLGLADVKDAFHRPKISKLYSSFLALQEVEGRDLGAPLVGACAPVSAAYRSVTPAVYFSARKQSKRQCGPPSLDKAGIFQDTRSCVVPRSSDESNDAESSRRAPKKFFFVYVDNLGILERHV